MISFIRGAFVLAILLLMRQPQSAAADNCLIVPEQPRCEYLQNPRGIDTSKPRLSWTLATGDGVRGARQTKYQIVVASTWALLEKETFDLWDSGPVESSDTKQIEYAGKSLRSRQLACWKVRVWDQNNRASNWSAAASWTMGLLNPADWGDAKWIGDPTPPPDGYDPLPAPLLRRTFICGNTGTHAIRATAYVSALGLYELHINGEKVGDHVLAPEWTDYRKRVQYQVHDVTPLLKSGDNIVGLLLGDGWYAGKIGLTGIVPKGPPRAIYGRQPRALMRLEIDLSDGTTQVVVSDGIWQSTLEGPLRVADLLDGETYDARREIDNWSRVDCKFVKWNSVKVFENSKVPLVAQPNEPIRVTRDITPTVVSEPKPGVYVFDMGQNMVGWCRLHLKNFPASQDPQTITLKHAEMLNPDGTIYTANLRGAAQTDRFTPRGGGEQIYEPRFTYHGFRYVEVAGLKEKPPADALIGRVLHSAAREVGTFECSEPLLNKLWQNILWTQRANLHSTPTDCPQRDERCGWMGDILAFAPTACFNMDMAAFFTKWIPDTRDAQADDGRFSDFAPHPFEPNARFSGVPAWGDAGVFVPWTAYEYYGDKRLLAEQYDAAVRWVEWIRGKNPDLLWKNNRNNDYGDWLNADTLKLQGWPTKGAEVPKEMFGTAFFARSTYLLSEMARVLGKADDAEKYAKLAADIRAAFCKAYVSNDGKLQGDTQAGYAIALNFDLLPENQRANAVQFMVDRFKPYDGQISTGFHSTVPLMLELSRRGKNDEAYRLVLNRKMPSWGYQIDHGATTIWERWDGWVEGRGFQDPGMNSFAHYAIGSVGEWLYKIVLGINPDPAGPGFEKFIIHPRPGPGVTWARGSYDSIRGKIALDWKLEERAFSLNLEVPANTSATVHLPASNISKVTEGGKPIGPEKSLAGVSVLRHENGEFVLRVESGKYFFEVRK